MMGTKHYGQATEENLRSIPGIHDWQIEGKMNSEDLAFYT